MKRVGILLLAFVIAISSVVVGDVNGVSKMQNVQAASKEYKSTNWREECKVGKKIFYYETGKKKVKKKCVRWVEDCSTYNICMKTRKKKTVLVKNVERTLLTNGVYLYYVKYKKYRATIYRMNIKTKKSKKMFMAPKKTSYYYCDLDGIKGKYIYYTTIPDNGDTGYYNYIYNTKLQKNKKLDEELDVSLWGKQLVLSGKSTSFENVNIYFAKLDGTKKRKVVSAAQYFVYKNKFYWIQVEYGKDYAEKYRLGCCDKKGKNKKVLSKWKKTLSQRVNYASTTKQKENCLKEFGISINSIT